MYHGINHELVRYHVATLNREAAENRLAVLSKQNAPSGLSLIQRLRGYAAGIPVIARPTAAEKA